MRSAAITLAIVGTVATVGLFAISEAPASTNLFAIEVTQDNVAFANYLAKYGKSYGTKEEFQFRYEQYQKNMAKVAQYNGQNGNTFRLGINKFTDYTPEEYKVLLGYKPQSKPMTLEASYLSEENTPASIDWREKGAVTPVKDQGQCGSCWAFSATGALEGHYQISNNKLISISEQQLVDCSHDGNNGCNGGEMYLAFDYASKNKMELESDYVYHAKDEKCSYEASKGKMEADHFQRVPKNSPAQLKAALANGPVSVAIEADNEVFQAYDGGILNSKECGTNLDHGVLAVGFGHDEATNQDYFIVKNSWGQYWGDHGFIKIAAVDGEGICGIQMDAVYPIVKKQ